MYLLLVEKDNHNMTSDYLKEIHLVGSLSIILMSINNVIVLLNYVVTSTNIVSYNLLYDLRFMVVIFSLAFLIPFFILVFLLLSIQFIKTLISYHFFLSLTIQFKLYAMSFNIFIQKK
jgi:hypothetical protein